MKKLLFSTLAIIGCANYSLGQSVPSYVPTSGLVGWWPFTGNALDSSGNGNHGTVTGALLTIDRNSKLNSAYSFDGNGDFINCGNSPTVNITGSVSISAWIYANKLSGEKGIISKMNTGISTYDLITGDNLFRWIDVGGFLFSNPIKPKEWIHVVSVFDSSLLYKSIYINGKLDTMRNILVGTIPTNSDNLYIGAHQPSNVPSWSWDGILDDIGIWNRALSACEISKLYLASNTFFTSKPANQAVKIGASASFTIKDTLGASATYQWQENAGTGFVNLSNTSPYSGVNTKTLDINPVVAGMHNNQYRCIRNGGSSCLDTSAAAILTLSNLSIKANQLEGLTIRPNPVHNSLNIHAPATISKMVLYNTLGQLMFESKPGTKTASIDMSVYPAGMYILKLNDEWVEKIIKE
jgi:hypothetical protein